MWTYYSVIEQDTPMIIRSSTEIVLLTCSAIYIIRNKIIERYAAVLPITNENENENK
jgi:hypothetical protein